MQTRGLLDPIEPLLPKPLSDILEKVISDLVGVLASAPKARADLSSLSAEEVEEQAESLTSKVTPPMAILSSRGEDNDMHDPPQDSSPAPSLPLSQLPTAPSQTPEPPAKADPPKLPIDPPVSPGTSVVQPPESAGPSGRRDSGGTVSEVVRALPVPLPRGFDAPNLPVSDLPVIPDMLGSDT
jgi:hypothetical protein